MHSRSLHCFGQHGAKVVMFFSQGGIVRHDDVACVEFSCAVRAFGEVIARLYLGVKHEMQC